ncbi:hypothetical protein CVS40_12847 [Lucilia cuprina]|nr:hypothetical protein CVS40_12847 [Lucilia cuprina]
MSSIVAHRSCKCMPPGLGILHILEWSTHPLSQYCPQQYKPLPSVLFNFRIGAVAELVRNIYKVAGFELRNSSSNSSEVLWKNR